MGRVLDRHGRADPVGIHLAFEPLDDFRQILDIERLLLGAGDGVPPLDIDHGLDRQSEMADIADDQERHPRPSVFHHRVGGKRRGNGKAGDGLGGDTGTVQQGGQGLAGGFGKMLVGRRFLGGGDDSAGGSVDQHRVCIGAAGINADNILLHGVYSEKGDVPGNGDNGLRCLIYLRRR